MQPSPKLDFSLVGFSRRSFLRRSGLIAALSPMAAMLLGGERVEAAALPFPPGPELDLAILNFALNLEYLEGEYYTLGTTGQTLAQVGIPTSTSAGAAGTLTVKASPMVQFQTPALEQFANEIAADEQNHIKFLQNTIADLGGTPIQEPSIDLLNSFHTIGSLTGIDPNLDPFSSESNFFLGGFSLTDVGVTAYHGAAPLITNKAVLAGAGGLLAVESYHDATLRLGIFQAGTTAQNNSVLISNLRDSLDDNGKHDKDQGVINADGTVNIVPTDSNSIIFARTFRQVLNIVYGGYKAADGGFFPAGANGDIK